MINGTIFYKRDIYENPYNPLPLKVIIDISTNETRWIDRKLISSTEFLCNMSFNETYLFSKNIIVSDPDSYLLEISIFALQPNKFWGTHWKQVGEKSLFITIPKK